LDPAHLQPPDHPLEVKLGGQVQLSGYDLAVDSPALTEPVQLTLYWQAIEPPTTDYTVFTQLIGPDGLVWAQQDNQPQAGQYPTTAWKPNDRVVDRYELFLSKDAPPGQYRLLVGMYDLASGQRLPAIAADGYQYPDHAIGLTSLTIE
jgi:hypothetical protein